MEDQLTEETGIPFNTQSEPGYQTDAPHYEQPDDGQIFKKKPGKRPKKGLIIGLAIVVVLSAVTVVLSIFWRPLYISRMGSKGYYALVERQNLASELSVVSALTMPSKQYNTYHLVANLKASDNAGLGLADFGGLQIDPVQMINNSTIEMMIGKVPAKNSMATEINWQYKGSEFMTATGYINKDRALIYSPQYYKESFFLGAGDMPELKPLFTLADTMAGQKQVTVDNKTFTSAVGNLLRKAADQISSGDVVIHRNVRENLGGKKVTCDKIEVSLTGSRLKTVLRGMLDAANGDKNISNVLSRYVVYLNTFYQIGEATGDAEAVPDVSYDGLKKAIDELEVSNVTMTLLVRNTIYGSTILSREISTDNGFDISYYMIKGVGSAEIRRHSQSESGDRGYKLNYSITKDKITGELKPVDVDENTGAARVKFDIDKMNKTAIGLNVSTFNITSPFVGTATVPKEFVVTVTDKGGRTQVSIEAKNGAQTIYTGTVTITGSTEVLQVSDFSPNNSINPITQPDLMAGSQYDIGANLIALMKKIGYEKPDA